MINKLTNHKLQQCKQNFSAKFKFKKISRKKRGFTLIELIVVMAIIGVLVLLASPKFFKQLNKADDVRIKNDIKVMEKSIDEYLVTHDSLPTEWEAVTPEPSENLYDISGALETSAIIENIPYKIIDKEQYGTSKLPGNFYSDDKGKVYYDTKEPANEEIVSCDNTGATAAEYFTFETSTGSITAYSSTGPKNVVIPCEISGVKVTTIKGYAMDNLSLTSVIIPNNVTTIGEYAFEYNLINTLSLTDSITTLGKKAFSSNRITAVDIPEKLTILDEYVFGTNRIISLVIPDSVTVIKEGAFYSNRLTSLEITNNAKLIGFQAFAYNELTSATIYKDVEYVENAFSSNYINSVTIEEGVTAIGMDVLNNNKLTSVTIPSSVTVIKSGAFSGNFFTTLIIPDTVINIDADAFSFNKLASVNFGSKVSTIGAGAFQFNKLTSVTIPVNVQSIGLNAFKNNGLMQSSGSFSTPGAKTWTLNETIWQ